MREKNQVKQNQNLGGGCERGGKLRRGGKGVGKEGVDKGVCWGVTRGYRDQGHMPIHFYLTRGYRGQHRYY